MWWEKTVEYLFVLTHLDKEILLAPLDGSYEAGGDLIASCEDKWVLIEFKRNFDAISDEVKKFPEPSAATFQRAKEALGSNDGHHLLIFGTEGKASPVELNALSYFRRNSVMPSQVLRSGVEQEIFNSYLVKFLEFKFGETQEGAGGRDLSYSSVLAVNGEGEVTHCEGLAGYCEKFGIGPKLTQRLAPTTNRSSGMRGPG